VNRFLAGALAVCGLSAALPAGALASRLEWRAEACELSRHRHCIFSDAEDGSAAHRFVTLRGTLRSFSPNDAALYAVYLTRSEDLKALRHLLDDLETPSDWKREAEASALLDGRASLEWIPVETNGRVVVRVDEAHVPGKRWVAVVNAEGEILGAHPLWSGAGPLAESR
jgi:hypothetical protein